MRRDELGQNRGNGGSLGAASWGSGVCMCGELKTV